MNNKTTIIGAVSAIIILVGSILLSQPHTAESKRPLAASKPDTTLAHDKQMMQSLIAKGAAKQTPPGTGSLASLQTGEAPWIAEIDHLRDRLDAIHLPALSAEGSALHTHQHLDIYIDGKPTPVPPMIGINVAAPFISPIHVHDTTGVIHVESPTVQTFTLGQFFDIWGVKFTSTSLGGYANQTSKDPKSSKTLRVFLNGQPYTGDPRNLALAAHQEIVITYGAPAELPNPIPSSFAFPAGE